MTPLLLAALFVLPVGRLAAEEPPPKASRYFEMLVKRPESATIYERFENAWLAAGTKKGLEEFLRKRAEEGTAAEWWILGINHQRGGRDEEALQALDEAVALDGANAKLRVARARVNARMLRFKEALADLDEIVEARPDEAVEAAKLKGTYLARSGKPDAAVEVWQALQASHPGDEELAEDLVELLIGEGQFEAALQAATTLAEGTRDAYQRALRRLRVAEIQEVQGNPELAVETYEAVLATTGHGTWLEREVLGQVEELFLRDDDLKGLRAFYKRNAEAHPQRVALKKALAQLVARSGEVEQAVLMLREVMKLSPGDRGLQREMVELLAANGREKEAASELENLLQHDVRNAELWERLAELYHDFGNEDGLRDALKEVEGLAGQAEPARLRLARVYHRFGLEREREAILRSTAEDGTLEAKEALAAFLMTSGEEAEALEVWRAMAEGAELDGLMRVVRSLQARGKTEVAWELMSKRRAEFGRDPVSLTTFCNVAELVGRPQDAVPEARRLVALAARPTELRDAVRLAARLIVRAGDEEAMLGSLDADATVNDLCLGAEIQESIGDSREADRLLQQAAQGVEGRFLALNQRVRLLERRKNVAGAAEAMRTIVESVDGGRPLYRKRLVELLMKAGDLPSALEEIGKWRQATPGDQLAWFAQAEVEAALGDHEAAVTTLRRARARFGAEREILVRLGEAHRKAGDLKAALTVFERLYEDEERATEKARWAGRLAKLARDDESAEELIAKFERRKRNNRKAVAPVLALAEIHRELGQDELRRATLREATRRRPEDLQLCFQLAEIEERAGDLEQAVETLREARRNDPSGEAERRLARLLLRFGKTEEAVTMLREADLRSIDPREAETSAKTMIAEMEWEAARDYLAPLATQFPENWRLRYLLAVCKQECGEIERAAQHFLHILRSAHPDPSLTGLTPLEPKEERERWSELGGTALPKAAASLNLLSLYRPHALEGPLIPYRPATGLGGVPLPGDDEEARYLALCHLVEDASHREGGRGAVEKALAEAGMPDLELLVMVKEPPENLAPHLGRLLEQKPRNRTLLLLALNASPMLPDAERVRCLRAARDELEDVLPLVSLLATRDLVAVADDDTREEALQKVPACLGPLRNDQLTAGLRVLSGLLKGGGNEPATLSAAQRDELYHLLLAGFRKSVSPLPRWSALEDNLLSYAAEQDRYDDVVDILNRICGRSQAKQAPVPVPLFNSAADGSLFAGLQIRINGARPAVGNAQFLTGSPFASTALPRVTRGGGSVDSSGIGSPVIPYPPTPLRAPVELIEKLQSTQDHDDARPAAFSDAHSAATNSLEPAKLVAEWDRLTDPFLRLTLLEVTGQDQRLAESVAAIANNPQALLDELLFAAAYYGREEEHALKAFELLQRARSHPMEADRAMEVDDYLVLLGGRLAAANKLNGEQRGLAKRAALRSHGAKKNQSWRQSGADSDQIVRALAQLGVVTASKPPKPRMALRPSHATSGGIPYSRRGRARNSWQYAEFVQLAKVGKRELAIQKARREFLRMQQTARHGRSANMPQFLEMLLRVGITDEVLDALDPGDDATIYQLERFASACLLWKRQIRAKRVLERALEMDPASTWAKTRLALLGPTREWTHKLSELNLQGEGFDLLREMSLHAANPTPSALEQLQMFTVILHVSAPTSRRDLGFIDDYAGVAATTAGLGDAFKDLCLGMLRHPQTAERGFILMRQDAAANRRNVIELKEAALSALHTIAKFPPVQAGGSLTNQMQPVVSFAVPGSPPEPEIGPVEYLASVAAAKQTPELLGDELVEELRGNHNALADRIEAYRQLLFGEGEERLTSFRKLHAVAAARGTQDAQRDFANGIRLLVEHAGDDSAFIEAIGKVLIEQVTVRRQLPQLKPWRGKFATPKRPSSPLSIYSTQLLKHCGPHAFEKFLANTTEHWLGERDDWRFLEETHEPGAPGWEARVATHFGIMEELIDVPETSFPVAVYLARSGLAQPGSGRLFEKLKWAASCYLSVEHKTAEDYFEDAGFFGDVADFDPVCLGSDLGTAVPSEATLLGMLESAQSGESDDSAVRNAAARWIKAEGSDRFGRRLLGAALCGRKSTAKQVVEAEVVRNKEAILALPIDRQVALAHFLAVWFGPELYSSDFPSEMSDWRTAMSKQARLREAARVKKWLETGFDLAAAQDPREQLKHVLQAVSGAATEDPDLAARLLARYLIVPRDDPRLGSRSPLASGMEDLGERWERLDVKASEVVHFFDRLLAQPESKGLSYDFGSIGPLGEAITRKLRPLLEDPELKSLQETGAHHELYWERALKQLTEGLPAEDEGIVATGLLHHVWVELRVGEEAPDAIRKIVKKWESEHPVLAAALSAGIHIREWERADAPAARKSNRRRLAQEAVASFLGCEKIPVELRYAVAHELAMDSHRWCFEGPAAESVSRMLTAYSHDGRILTSGRERGMLTSLAEEDAHVSVEALRELLDVFGASLEDPAAPTTTSGDREFDRTLIRLAARAGRDDTLDRLLGTRRETPYAGDLGLMRFLFLARKVEQFQRLLPEPDDSTFAGRYYGTWNWDRRCEETAADALSKIEPAESRYRLQALFASRPDAPGAELEERQGDRLARLASDFAERAPQDPLARIEILEILARAPELPPEVRDEIVVKARKIDLGTHLVMKEGSPAVDSLTGRDVRHGLVTAAVRFEIAAGKTDAIRERFQRLAEQTKWDASDRGNTKPVFEILLGAVLDGFVDSLANETLPPGRFLALSRMLVEQSFDDPNREPETVRTALLVALTTHALAGKGQELDQAIASLPEEIRVQAEALLRDSRALWNLFEFLQNDRRWAAPRHAPIRQRVLQAIVMDQATSAWMIPHLSVLVDAAGSGAFTVDDVVAVTGDLPRDHPRLSELLLARGEILGKTSENREETTKCYTRATEVAQSRKDAIALNQCHAYFARYHAVVLNDPIRAAELAAMVDTDLLGRRDRVRFEMALERD